MLYNPAPLLNSLISFIATRALAVSASIFKKPQLLKPETQGVKILEKQTKQIFFFFSIETKAYYKGNSLHYMNFSLIKQSQHLHAKTKTRHYTCGEKKKKERKRKTKTKRETY